MAKPLTENDVFAVNFKTLGIGEFGKIGDVREIRYYFIDFFLEIFSHSFIRINIQQPFAFGFLSAKIPANSTLAEADTTLVTPHTGATATVTIRDDTGNIVAVNDPAASVVEWTFSTGCGPDNGDTFGVVDAAAADVDAGFVKVKLYIK